MGLRRRNRLVALAAVATAAVFAAAASGTSVATEPAGFRALSGPEAASFSLPGDVELVRSLDLAAYGLSYERYQQRFGSAGARVVGGQLSVYRDASGIRAVTGAHYQGVTPTNRIQVTAVQAREVSERELGRDGERTTELWIDPVSGRYQWQVETPRFGFRRLHVIEAQSGQVLQRLDLLMSDDGVGVKSDTKSMTGLTRFAASDIHCTGDHYDLESADGRQTTLDARNGTFFIYPVCDTDNHWTLAGRSSPGQPALVDAHFYANVTDDYYQGRHGFNWLACYPGGPFDGPGMRSAAHIGVSYNNAFWDGRYTAYGDGDGTTFREFSGGLDVVAHEHTHGVTDCTSDLVYSGESGALNEAFSDMLGAAAEFFFGAAEPADYLVGEDIYLPADPGGAGFRNMTDPEEDEDPDHYTERFTGTADNGGVHTNSAIPNHAFYLLAEGGMNASCAAPSTHSAAHCTDGDADDNITVTSIGREAAERITFLAYIGLTTNATMCDARAAMEAQATALYGSASQELLSARDAYVAVGLTDAVCGFTPPPPPPTPTTSHIGDLDGASTPTKKGWRANVTIVVHDDAHNAIAGAAVTGTWSGGAKGTATCTTGGTQPQCTVSKTLSAGKPSVTFTVTGVTHATLGYDPADNHDVDGDSNGTAILVAK